MSPNQAMNGTPPKEATESVDVEQGNGNGAAPIATSPIASDAPVATCSSPVSSEAPASDVKSGDMKTIDMEKGNGPEAVDKAAPVAISSPVSSKTPVATSPVSSKPSSYYRELQPSQFDSIISYLSSQRLKAPWYSPKGTDGDFPKGSDGWFATLFVTKGRAFDFVFWPWLICTINVVIWTTLTNSKKLDWDPIPDDKANNYRSAFQLGLSATLSFLLVFRLNRSILRFWEAMKAWGNIVYYSRSLVSSVLVHGRDIPYERDQVVVWVAAIAIAAKKTLRQVEVEIDDLQGLLTADDIRAINTSYNSSLYAANEARYHLKQLFDVTKEFGPLSPARSGEMRQHEKLLDFIILNVGNAENILQTPLPLVYVSHLRTFLMVYLLALPYLTAHLWAWATIPIISMTAALMLGIEGASAEVESPFEKGKANDLDLDNYCEILMRDIQQLVKRNNDRNKNKLM